MPPSMAPRLGRRAFLGLAAGTIGFGQVRSPGGGAGPDPADIEARLKKNIYTRLFGIRPHLAGHPNITRLGGVRLSREVMAAMSEANEYFVDMPDLIAAAGRRIAKVTGAEAGLVTAGASSAQLLGAAACLTGSDPEKIAALPHPTWPKRECLIQKAHRSAYDHAYRAAGMTIVEVDTREEFAAALGPATAMIAVTAQVDKQRQPGPPLPRGRSSQWGPEVMRTEELIQFGKRAGVPVLVDAAAEVPPASNLTRFIEMGADLVAFSGGKGIQGPQSTGILAGRKDLIEAATLHASPNDHIGRGMKVSKEEIVGLIVALNLFVARNQAATVERWNEKAKWVAGQLRDIPGLSADYVLLTGSDQAVVELVWDEQVIPMTAEDLRVKLMTGHPKAILYRNYVWTSNLRDGEEVLLVRRLREVFSKRS